MYAVFIIYVCVSTEFYDVTIILFVYLFQATKVRLIFFYYNKKEFGDLLYFHSILTEILNTNLKNLFLLLNKN